MKHFDDSTITQDDDILQSTTNSSIQVENQSVLQGDQVEGEHLNSMPNAEGEHSFEVEHDNTNADVVGEHNNSHTIIEGEQNGSIPTNSTIQIDVFHDMNDNVSNAGEGT